MSVVHNRTVDLSRLGTEVKDAADQESISKESAIVTPSSKPVILVRENRRYRSVIMRARQQSISCEPVTSAPAITATVV